MEILLSAFLDLQYREERMALWCYLISEFSALSLNLDDDVDEICEIVE